MLIVLAPNQQVVVIGTELKHPGGRTETRVTVEFPNGNKLKFTEEELVIF